MSLAYSTPLSSLVKTHKKWTKFLNDSSCNKQILMRKANIQPARMDKSVRKLSILHLNFESLIAQSNKLLTHLLSTLFFKG